LEEFVSEDATKSSENSEKGTASAGRKTRARLKFLDALSAGAVLVLILEFWYFQEDQLGVVALWLLIVVILAAQIAKLRLKCPSCSGSAYRGWRYSYRAKVPGTCPHCDAPLP
jgi:hypothetical protein